MVALKNFESYDINKETILSNSPVKTNDSYDFHHIYEENPIKESILVKQQSAKIMNIENPLYSRRKSVI